MFERIIDLFKNQAEIQSCEISFHIVAAPIRPDSFLDIFIQGPQNEQLPKKLKGDYKRL